MYTQKLPLYMVISLLGSYPAFSSASLPQDINHYFRQIHGKNPRFNRNQNTTERWPICEKPLNQPTYWRA